MLELVAGRSRATIAPADGGRLAQLDLGGGPLLRAREPGIRWVDWGCFVLAPWSNRLPGGLVQLGGLRAQVPVNWPDGTAIHGLVGDVAWAVVETTPTSAALIVDAAEGPWTISATQRYALDAGRLVHEVSVRNAGTEAVPAGLGIHPWFRAGRVRVPAPMKWPGDPLPTGAPVPVGDVDDLRHGTVPPPMDRCFTGLTDTYVEAPGVRLSWHGPVAHVVVYTGEPGWVAVEPVTMANGGFGLADRGIDGHGVVVLAPGEELSATYEFTSAR